MNIGNPTFFITFRVFFRYDPPERDQPSKPSAPHSSIGHGIFASPPPRLSSETIDERLVQSAQPNMVSRAEDSSSQRQVSAIRPNSRAGTSVSKDLRPRAGSKTNSGEPRANTTHNLNSSEIVNFQPEQGSSSIPNVRLGFKDNVYNPDWEPRSNSTGSVNCVWTDSGEGADGEEKSVKERISLWSQISPRKMSGEASSGRSESPASDNSSTPLRINSWVRDTANVDLDTLPVPLNSVPPPKDYAIHSDHSSDVDHAESSKNNIHSTRKVDNLTTNLSSREVKDASPRRSKICSSRNFNDVAGSSKAEVEMDSRFNGNHETGSGEGTELPDRSRLSLNLISTAAPMSNNGKENICLYCCSCFIFDMP